ncbi:MAG: tRNA (adenosine(37)-N6)-threonylcarbamoyltransferase complex dimerization subunit type 1 TsaB [Gemmatimonadetes bacterium]|nr:tRNA (adenosine(37)-N6)-threonylcarbamoyltransferase complex dimerization subunit type 1 TsaB [Gemmatimonadota bacterium]NIO30374.1 tRNA (adenosine(37)-N6)-threonylcarbamoyltransferase complex dimerization subunit type 1 TsaB [Gemmatimonadota bacterium]
MVKTGRRESASGEGPEPQIWLALETATSVGSVAVWRDGLAIECSFNIRGSHSERVLPAVDHALEVTGTSPEDVAALVVGCGPGSFTGVRIAASLAKGWTMARGTPLFAYPSLLALAAGTGVGGPVCAAFDARRAEVYAACYEISEQGATERLAPAAWRLEDLLDELARRDLKPAAFVGDGATAHRGRIAEALAGALVLPEHLAVPRAASLLWLRSVDPQLGHVAQPADWEPLYVRDWRVPEERGGE